MSEQRPYEIGSMVISVCSVNAVGLDGLKCYVIAERIERPMFPAGPKRWFYRLQGMTKCNVYHDFVRPALGTCTPHKIGP